MLGGLFYPHQLSTQYYNTIYLLIKILMIMIIYGG